MTEEIEKKRLCPCGKSAGGSHLCLPTVDSNTGERVLCFSGWTMKTVAAIAYFALGMFALGALLAGCSQPGPIVTLGPTEPLPADRFAGQVYDCQAAGIAEEMGPAADSVRCCLRNCASLVVEAFDSCIVRQTQHSDAALMCALREVGVAETVAVTRGDASRADAATSVRRFIVEHGLGYR